MAGPYALIMRILVTGATGFVGRHLARSLDDDGHEVVAMTRRPEAYDGAGTAVAGDIDDEPSLRTALEGVDVAYYLVHSLADEDFAARDRRGAQHFALVCWSASRVRVLLRPSHARVPLVRRRHRLRTKDRGEAAGADAAA